MTVLIVTVQWFREGIGYALELNEEVYRRFRDARLKLDWSASLLMNELVDRLPQNGAGPTQDDVVRFLDHLDTDWGLANLPLPKRIRWQEGNSSL
jgi:hypothetical protein